MKGPWSTHICRRACSGSELPAGRLCFPLSTHQPPPSWSRLPVLAASSHLKRQGGAWLWVGSGGCHPRGGALPGSCVLTAGWQGRRVVAARGVEGVVAVTLGNVALCWHQRRGPQSLCLSARLFRITVRAGNGRQDPGIYRRLSVCSGNFSMFFR